MNFNEDRIVRLKLYLSTIDNLCSAATFTDRVQGGETFLHKRNLKCSRCWCVIGWDCDRSWVTWPRVVKRSTEKCGTFVQTKWTRHGLFSRAIYVRPVQEEQKIFGRTICRTLVFWQTRGFFTVAWFADWLPSLPGDWVQATPVRLTWSGYFEGEEWRFLWTQNFVMHGEIRRIGEQDVFILVTPVLRKLAHLLKV